MTKDLCYLYLGENGTVLTPVKLETIQYVEKYSIVAAPGHMVTKDGVNFYHSIVVPASEGALWYEVEKLGQE